MKKYYLVFLLFVGFTAGINSQTFDIFTGTRSAPKMQDCGCKKFVALKQSKSTTKEGVVTVYNDALIFRFGTSVKEFVAETHLQNVWSDDKGKIYLLRLDQSGTKLYLKISNTFYIILPDEQIYPTINSSTSNSELN